MEHKRILIMGATGSIGRQTLDVIGNYPERLRVVGLAADSNWELIAQQAEQFQVEAAALTDEEAAKQLSEVAPGLTVYAGDEGLQEIVGELNPDLVVAAISGLAGLPPIMTALEQRCDVALANKEPLVAAGERTSRKSC